MQYLTNIVTIASGFIISAAAGYFIIPLLRRIQFGRSIYETGPVWQKKKNGTPTMGGFICITGVISAYAAGSIINDFSFPGNTSPEKPLLLAGLIYAVINAGIGFAEDHTSDVIRRPGSIPPLYKQTVQAVFAALYLYVLFLLGDTSRSVYIPFMGETDFGLFYYPLMVIYLIAMNGAVCAESSRDGICGTVTAVLAASWLILCTSSGMTETGIFSSALAGGCLGFLLWNLPPSKVIIGKTGAMFLSGCICALGIESHQQLLLLIAAAAFIPDGIIAFVNKLRKNKSEDKIGSVYDLLKKKRFSEYKIILLYGCTALFWGAAANIIFSVSNK